MRTWRYTMNCGRRETDNLLFNPPSWNIAVRPFAVAWLFAAMASAACASAPVPDGQPAGAGAGRRLDSTAADVISDTGSLVPPGYGTLRQEDIAIRLTLQGVQARAIPLDEGIIRVLSPDSYRALRDLLASRQREVATIAARYGVRRPSVWYVSYFGIEPEARFSPMEVVVTSAGREHRPLDIIPLSPGFGENRLRQRETQTALYVFDEDVDPEQPLTVSMQGERNTAWSEILQRIQRERVFIRSRASSRP